MANPNNSLDEFDIKVRAEINHEQGKAISEIIQDGKVIKSMRYVQGMYFDENNRLMSPEDAESFKWLLRVLIDKK